MFGSSAGSCFSPFLDIPLEIETAKAGIWVLPDKWNQKKQMGLIKVNNKHVDNLKTSLTLIKSFKRQQIIVRSVGVSGMINKADKKYLAM